MKNVFKTSALIATVGLMATTAYAESITVTSFGGAYSNSQREAYWKPYTADTGITVVDTVEDVVGLGLGHGRSVDDLVTPVHLQVLALANLPTQVQVALVDRAVGR